MDLTKQISTEVKSSTPSPIKRYATVSAVLDKGLYQVEDDQGRKFNVDSDNTYVVGTGVTIQSGRIVGFAKKFISATVVKL